MSNLKRNGRLRWSPSYLRRRGQMTPAQKRALREHWATFGVEYQHGQTLGLSEIFASSNSVDSRLHLEIGFGMGENLIHQATSHPDALILGIEVHQPGIAAAILKIVDTGVNNVRVMRGDARLVLSDFLEPAMQFKRVSILFPDPWPDVENAHRRIVNPDLIQLLEKRMVKGGALHIATDVDLYADHSREIMAERSAQWQSCSIETLSNFRCTTQYEKKGVEKGHSISDLLYHYQG